MPVLRTTQGHEEFEEARREGVRFITRRGPKRFLGNGRLAAVELRARAIRLRHQRPLRARVRGRRVVAIEADACILAIGQKPDLVVPQPG